ncbi:hypothetical protein MML48_9g00018651 [Holotrichia oblita]|uniref:Uncharacterized protein n=1 Tax=Holotrichia oblita TaxID=644536 RepID=A0ACB9SK97_HOLOL|nr:hypothetical protein MML48_9g00018651 [Holotrichia oblita]
MANRPSFMQDFINLYRKHKCLWKIKDSTYANRALRTKAYEELLDLYKTVDVEATLESVKNKINNMRSAFRKELKKVKLSKKSGTSPDETYTPSLWYYDSLLFTADQEECRETFSSSMDMQDESEKVDNEENEGIPKLKMVNKSVSSKVTNKKKGKSIAKKNVTPKVSKKNVKKQESSDSSEEDEDLVLDDDSDLDCDIGEEEADCMFCSGFFSDDHAGEQWIQCSKCFKWAHCDCANIGRKDTYICDFCLDA